MVQEAVKFGAGQAASVSVAKRLHWGPGRVGQSVLEPHASALAFNAQVPRGTPWIVF